MSTQDRKLFDLLDGFEMTKSEYDWLERRFENMTVKEALLFRGAMQIERPEKTCDVMQVINQLDHYELFYGARDDAGLGRFVMEQIKRPASPTRAYLNPDKGDYGIRVKLASRSNMNGVWVGFPDTSEYMDSSRPDELLLALDALEAETLTECIAVDVDCCLPQLRDILSQYDSVAELIRHAIDFGYVWAEQGQGEPRWLDKWLAVMELEDCHRLDHALDLAQNLHCYNFMPRDMEVAEYGRLLAKQDGVYPTDELLASCFDAEGYANQKMRNLGLSAAEHGYVSWNGTEILFYEYSQPPSSQEMSM